MRPGRTAATFSYLPQYSLSTADATMGLGPTMLISPLSTLMSWGSSSIFSRRMIFPTANTLSASAMNIPLSLFV